MNALYTEICRSVYIYIVNVYSCLLLVLLELLVYEVERRVLEGREREDLAEYKIAASRGPLHYEYELIAFCAHLPEQLLHLKVSLGQDYHLERE